MIRALLLLAALAGCSPRTPASPASTPIPSSPLVLVSLDGFRWDYLDRGLTPALSRIAAEGVRARALVPVFPTKTFPNHYGIVTGRYPAAHGIVGNEFTDPALGRFDMRDRTAVRDARFWRAEPLWVTAERAGLRTAPWFWPGSEAAIGGVRPTWWMAYRHDMPDSARVRLVLDYLARPGARPAFVTLYLSLVDEAGHDYGPDAPATDSAIVRADQAVARLVDGLAQLAGPRANLVIVSDHGMAATAPARTVLLDDLVDSAAIVVDAESPVLMARPTAGLEDSVLRGLRRAAHLRVYRRDELPARYRLDASPRIAPVVAVADEGWRIGRRRGTTRGDHGYDDSLHSMAGIFLAQGPGLRRGVMVPAFRNIHVYPLLARLLGVPPAEAIDASLDSVRVLLAESDTSGTVPR